MSLNQVTDISTQSGEGGLPWWGILLIIIGCLVIAAACGTGYHFYSQRKIKKIAESQVKQNNMNQLEYQLERAKNQYVEVGDN